MSHIAAPRYLDEMKIGDRFRSTIGRTVTESDNIWFTCLTHNANQAHFNRVIAERSSYGKPLVNSALTLALITGLSVEHTSKHAFANLGWAEVRLPAPVFPGDTLWAETEVLDVRESRSRPDIGVVTVRSRGVNQRGEVVIEFRRSFALYRRGEGPPPTGEELASNAPWRV